MTGVRAVLIAAMALALSACGLSLKPDEQAFALAQTVYVELIEGKDEALMARLPEEVHNPTTLRTMGVLRDLLPEGQAQPAKLVGWHNNAGTGGQTANLVLRYDYAQEHVLATMAFHRKSDKDAWSLINVNIRGAAAGEVSAPAFLTGTQPPPMVTRKAPADS